MFCPECKAEYRAGFTRCADCDVELVAALPEAGHGSMGRANMQEVWSGEEQQSCVEICLVLREAGIPYEVAQRSAQFLQKEDARFTIAVPSEFCKQAKELAVDVDGEDLEQQEIIQAAEDDSNEAPDTREEKRRYLTGWYAEDATIEVTSKSAREWTALIISSLRENLIRFRESVAPDGSKQIFVLPEDEVRARGIVREIEERRPAE